MEVFLNVKAPVSYYVSPVSVTHYVLRDTTEYYLQTMFDYKTFTSASLFLKRFRWAIIHKSNKINSEISVLLDLKITHNSILTSVDIIFLFLGQ